MDKRSIVGDLINFRGLVYSPMNENGVIFMFGKIIEDLNMYVEEIKPGFPDCVGRRFSGKGWERVYIEFEYKSSNFKEHKHNVKDCDVVVCWEHDWPECPIEVIELKDIIRGLSSKPIQRPDLATEEEKYHLEDHLEKVSLKVRTLLDRFDQEVKSISGEIWSKTTSNGLTYYSPERVFIYLELQQQGLRLTVFTRGEELRGVEKGIWTKGGAKWASTHVKKEKDLETAQSIARQSYELMRKAVKQNEATGWYAELEEEKRDELATENDEEKL